MIGRWQGAGVIGYPGTESANFGQEPRRVARRPPVPAPPQHHLGARRRR
nr:hypothetical protein [Angustibacter aerolatus]